MSTKIYIWPDDTWCFEDEYPYQMNEKSDDFRVVEVSDDWDYDQIEEFIFNLNRGKL